MADIAPPVEAVIERAQQLINRATNFLETEGGNISAAAREQIDGLISTVTDDIGAVESADGIIATAEAVGELTGAIAELAGALAAAAAVAA